MERRELHQDDLTEERYPSPARRDEVAATEVLDPDVLADDGNGTSQIDDDDEDDEDDEDDL